MGALLIGYARVSTDEQTSPPNKTRWPPWARRVYLDHGLTGTNRDRPGLREALAACRDGDTLVVTKLDRLARTIADELTARQVRLRPDQHAHPGRNEGRQDQGRLRGKKPKLTPRQEAHLVSLHATGDCTTGELGELFRGPRPYGPDTRLRNTARTPHTCITPRRSGPSRTPDPVRDGRPGPTAPPTTCRCAFRGSYGAEVAVLKWRSQ